VLDGLERDELVEMGVLEEEFYAVENLKLEIGPAPVLSAFLDGRRRKIAAYDHSLGVLGEEVGAESGAASEVEERVGARNMLRRLVVAMQMLAPPRRLLF